jgi:PAS domain S-box-containing protein
MKETVSTHQNVIGRRLFRQSLLIALIMTLVLTIFQLWLKYQDLQFSVNSTFNQIKQVQVTGISTALWNFSMPELEAQTAGIANYPFVNYVEVSDLNTNKIIVYDGIKLNTNFQDERIPLLYKSGGNSIPIGYLYVQVDNNKLLTTLVKDIIIAMVFSAINVLILTLIFLSLIDRRVTRHLNAAAEYFRIFDVKSKNPPLKLNKPEINDELDSLVTAFNQMQTNLTVAYEQQSEMERKHATLLSNMPGMAYRCRNDREWTMEVVSAGCQDLTGYSAEEIVDNKQLSYNDLILPEDRDYVWETIQEQLKERLAFEINYRIQTKYGQNKWVWERGIGIYSLDSELIAIEGFITDITERKRQERELEAIAAVSYALRIAETRDDILQVVLDQTTRLLNANGGLIEFIDPATGDSVVEIASGSYEKLLGNRIGIDEGLNRYIRETGKPYLNNNVFDDPRNLTPTIDQDCRAASGVPMFAHGQLIGFLWIGRNNDISEKVVSTLSAIADIAANAIYRVSLYHQKEQQVNQLTGLRKIDTAINSNFELSYTLNILLEQTVELLHVKAACISSFDSKAQMINHLAGIGLNVYSLEHNQMIEQTGIAGRAIFGRYLVRVNDIEIEKIQLPQLEKLGAEGIKSCFAAPLIAKDDVIGVFQVFLSDPYYPDTDWIEFMETLAGQAAIAISDSNLLRNLKQSNIDLEKAYDATLEGWSNALDLRDKETEEHTERVTQISLQLAKILGLHGEDIRNIWRGARLHDIGKMGISDEILLKAGKLSPEEWVIMKEHPVNAYKLLYPISFLRQALDIPYCHHERWDGKGYPRGLKEEEIPLAARIFAVVDVWDAMTQDRVYRKALSEEEALQYITENSGKHFDPKIVELFLRLIVEQKSDQTEDKTGLS